MSIIQDGKGSGKEAQVDTTGALKTSDRGPFGTCDEINVTYPTTTSELFTYRLDREDLGTVLVIYTTSTKDVLLSVVYTEIS